MELLIVILAELLVVTAIVIPWVNGIEKLKDDPEWQEHKDDPDYLEWP